MELIGTYFMTIPGRPKFSNVQHSIDFDATVSGLCNLYQRRLYINMTLSVCIGASGSGK